MCVDGRRIRLLTIVDDFTRESLSIVVGQHLRGRDLVADLTRIGFGRLWPKTIRVDNGPEFTSKALDQWAYAGKVTPDFSRPGKPTDNAFIGSFNGRLRAEWLNENRFLSANFSYLCGKSRLTLFAGIRYRAFPYDTARLQSECHR